MSASTRPLLASSREDAIPMIASHTSIPRPATSSPPPRELHSSSQAGSLLPTSHQHVEERRRTITCYDHLGHPKTHGPEQRYVSPTTGVCRKLTVQAVRPVGPHEHRIQDQMTQVNKLGVWLFYTSALDDGMFFKWVGTWLLFTLKLTWWLAWAILQAVSSVLGLSLGNQPTEDSVAFTGRYKPYHRPFRGLLWEAPSRQEHSSRSKQTIEGKGKGIRVHVHCPRVLMLRDATRDRWMPCEDRDTILRTKYIAISYSAPDMYRTRLEGGKEFTEEVRAAVIRQNFDAYWLDLECLSHDEEQKKLDLFCMQDVYRRAERTLIVLNGDEDAWKRWGGRTWALPEVLLSKHLYCMFRGRLAIEPLSLRQLANLAYPEQELEQALMDAQSGDHPLERLERLNLLKAAIFRHDPQRLGTNLSESGPPSPPSIPSSPNTVKTPEGTIFKNRVYALMCFFEHRIEPDHVETEMCAFARLSMANANDRIAERMVSLFPSDVEKQVGWYMDDDIYSANLCDIQPEVHVAGITESGALVLDGCRAASIRWKDFPDLTFTKSDWVGGALVGYLPYLAWPLIYIGILFSVDGSYFGIQGSNAAGAVLSLVNGILLLLFSPWLFVTSEGKHAVNAQPWLIGVKGVLDVDAAAAHLVPGGNRGRRCNLVYTPSGSPFAVAEERGARAGSKVKFRQTLEGLKLDGRTR